jgi:hypothetical protein
MSTRTIVTSRPDVACDVCERRLLRGEHADTFIAAGRRLTVCDLCAAQVVHEGWTRESDVQDATLPPSRPRRGRSFVERLRAIGRSEGAFIPLEERGEPAALAPYRSSRATPAREESPSWVEGEGFKDGGDEVESLPTYAELAVEVFNESEFPRRVAGVARSLGAPEVSVWSAEHLESVVRILVAWELSWYRYEVDLSEGPGEARLLEQGTELDELERGERISNGSIDSAGAILLIAP